MQSCASPGRGDHAAAMRAVETVFACREEAAALFHMTQPENVVFTMNATHALNIAVHSLVREGMRVAVSGFEHNAVMRPLYASGASILTSDTPLFDSAALIDWFERHLPGCDAAPSAPAYPMCSASFCRCGRSRHSAGDSVCR